MRARTTAAIAAVTAAAMVISLLSTGSPALAQPDYAQSWRPPATQTERSVPGAAFTPEAKAPDPGTTAVLRTAPAVHWPAAGTVEVSPPAAARSAQAGPARTRAGSLPVWVGAPEGRGAAGQRLRVGVLDRSAAERAGVAGLLLVVGRTETSASTDPTRLPLEVDYSSFRSAYGGDWASRLRLVELPACALTTPQRADCRAGRPLASRNDPRAGRVSADVELAGGSAATGDRASSQVFALTAAASGNAGSFTATSLSASSSWDAGNSSGDFGWHYPLEVPPGLGGPEPELELDYSSGTVDGRTISTNNQSSWVGEGWDLGTDYIERRYVSCSDEVATTPKPYDLCWKTDNAFLSLGNRTVELVKDAASGGRPGEGGVWRARQDDGTRVEQLVGATNGDNNGEHWKVTDPDGTQYFFGLNRLPGWSAGNEITNSTWTVPVFGAGVNDPCHGSTFATSYCNQAWRWNLDYVVDPNGNASSYFYDTETNYYGRNRTASAGTAYTRAGYLKRIDYGQRSNTIYSAPAPMRVVFDVEERCAAGATCGTGTITKETTKNWPDVPYDQNCNSGATCTDLFAPTFWTRKRLTTVTTKVWQSGTTYTDVDSWALKYEFRDPGDGTSPSLWLASIAQTGKVGGSLTLPAVTFQGTQLENRVDADEGIPPMYKWRVTDVYDESGGHVRVNYSGRECVRSALPNPETNTKRCFPQYWTPEGATAPQLDWFHKYVAVQVLEDDVAGVAGIEQTDYEYLGGGAWRYDDSELTPAKYRTWGQWRGYGRVRTTSGASTGVRSQDETLYFRGMNGDKLTGGTRSVSVTDSENVAVVDHPALAGMVREEITYTGAGGSVLEGAIYDPWISAATATQGTTTAHLVEVAKERERIALAAGGWRRTEVRTSYDSYGLPVEINDLGDVSTADDDECTRITYARDTTLWLLDYEARVEAVGVACTVTPAYPADVISDDRTFYDGSTTLGAAPTKGDVTLTQELSAYSGSTPSYVTVERTVFDSYGRQIESYDVLNRRMVTEYTPSTGGPVTGIKVTNPMGWVESTTLAPAWGEPTTLIDMNGKRTDIGYDPLGRVAEVWLPDRSKANKQTPNQKFSYLVRNNAPIVITSEEIRDDGSYDRSYEFLDGRLRARQIQEPVASGGRLVVDTFYDSRGLPVKSSGPYWNSGTASSTLLTGVGDNAVPAQTVTVYDGAEQVTSEIFLSYGVEKWRNAISYGGDRVHVTPPDGDTATTTLSDADGRITELRQYAGSTPSGSYDATKYTYTRGGALATVTDPAGNVWRYGYDLRGRKISEQDPDRGTTTYTYDDTDTVQTSTDARGVTLANSYDLLGRRTGLHLNSTSGTKLASWAYDTLANGTVVNGQFASATRYIAGEAYVTSTNGYDSRYRSMGVTITIPGGEGKLAGSYRVNTGYTETGLPQTLSYPAAGTLAPETLRYSYDADGQVISAQTGLATLLTAASYTPYGEPSQLTLSATSGKQLTQTFFYEEGSRRLLRARTDRNVSTPNLADVNYSYDPAGNVTRIADTPAGGNADTQCFRYDHLRRLTLAWTANNNCATDPSRSVLGGPAPYWQSWSYDKTGNRLSETNYNVGTGVGVTSNSEYPAAGGTRPHALSKVTTNGQINSYSYDPIGNTTGRTVAGSDQTLIWNDEGHLTKVVEGAKTTEFVYDADGTRLLRRDADGVTLYLGHTELKLSKAGAVSATRYYNFGVASATRTSGGLSFEATDQHGTSLLAVAATDLSVNQRRYLPFGQLRGTAPASWPSERSYVGGTFDAAIGLIHLGAREYDPSTGRFISVDPAISYGDPQQLNGYSYANNTPITANDADGLWPKFLKKLGNKVKKATKKVVKKVVKTGKRVVKAVKKTVKTAKAAVKKAVKKVVAKAKRVVKKARAVVRHVVKRAKSVARKVGSAIKRAGAAAARTVKRIGSGIKRGVQAAVSTTRRAGSAAVSGARRAAAATASAAVTAAGASAAAASKAAGWVGSGIMTAGAVAAHLNDHIYASASLCLMACLNLGVQGGKWSVTLTGGWSTSSDASVLRGLGALSKLKGGANMFGGVSVGYSTATVDEQESQLAAVTAARGWYGANGGVGQRKNGDGLYYFGGYSAGYGTALQGPALWSWEPGLHLPKPLGG